MYGPSDLPSWALAHIWDKSDIHRFLVKGLLLPCESSSNVPHERLLDCPFPLCLAADSVGFFLVPASPPTSIFTANASRSAHMGLGVPGRLWRAVNVYTPDKRIRSWNLRHRQLSTWTEGILQVRVCVWPCPSVVCMVCLFVCMYLRPHNVGLMHHNWCYRDVWHEWTIS